MIRDLVTDFDNTTLDTGRMLTVFVIGSMVILQGYALWRGQSWEPMSFGGGIAAVLTSLAAYLYGDSKARPGRVTVIESSSTTTTTPQREPPHGTT